MSSRLYPWAWVPVVAWLLAACGGTEDAPRPERDLDAPLEPLVDTGSAPPDCSADDGYDIRLIEDWETGAGTGWYSNNEYCQSCTDLQDALDEISRPTDCIYQMPDRETGCDPTAVGSESAAALNDLRDAVNFFLPDADPSDDELLEMAAAFRACWKQEGTGYLAYRDRCGTSDLLDELYDSVFEAAADGWSLQAELGECRVSCDPTQTPPAMAKPFPAEEIPGGRCGSTMAAHVELHRWIHREGTLGRQFSATKPVDASDYDGVSFWLRVVPGSRNTFRISVPDRFTDEKSEVDGVPVCQFINPKELTDNSCDKFGRYFLATTDWQFFTIPFDEMRQAGFGKQAPYFDIANLLGLALEYKQGQWDYWIDDIGFYRKKK
jgi:hypothetical protein